jgi:hypothetical protein
MIALVDGYDWQCARLFSSIRAAMLSVEPDLRLPLERTAAARWLRRSTH